ASMLRICPAALGLSLLAAPALAEGDPPSPAGAESPEDTAADPPPSPALGNDVRVVLSSGVFNDTGKGSFGFIGGAAALVRISLFEAGVFGQGGKGFFDYTFGSGGALLGVTLQTPLGFRADLLGEIGFDRYIGVGNDDFLKA